MLGMSQIMLLQVPVQMSGMFQAKVEIDPTRENQCACSPFAAMLERKRLILL
jgi:hypothetical protein